MTFAWRELYSLPMKAASPSEALHTVPAVSKAIDLLQLLAEEPGETTTKALAYRLGIPRSTCYRILRSLAARNWVRPLPGGGHALSLGLLPLLASFHPLEALARTLQPSLEALARATRLTAKASVRQGDVAVTVARCESPEGTSVSVRIGASFHLAFGSSGSVLLSDLPTGEVQELLDRAPAECWQSQDQKEVARRLRELKSKGWCSDLGTFRPVCHALSAPVTGAHGRIAAALTVIGFSHEVTRDRIASLGEAVAAQARVVSAAFQVSSSPSPRPLPRAS